MSYRHGLASAFCSAALLPTAALAAVNSSGRSGNNPRAAATPKTAEIPQKSNQTAAYRRTQRTMLVRGRARPAMDVPTYKEGQGRDVGNEGHTEVCKMAQIWEGNLRRMWPKETLRIEDSGCVMPAKETLSGVGVSG